MFNSSDHKKNSSARLRKCSSPSSLGLCLFPGASEVVRDSGFCHFDIRASVEVTFKYGNAIWQWPFKRQCWRGQFSIVFWLRLLQNPARKVQLKIVGRLPHWIWEGKTVWRISVSTGISWRSLALLSRSSLDNFDKRYWRGKFKQKGRKCDSGFFRNTQQILDGFAQVTLGGGKFSATFPDL